MTEVKVVFIVFETPPKSRSELIDLAQPKARHIFVNGSMNTSRNFSIILINSIIEPFVTIAVDILPPIVNKAIIKGINALITLHNISMYEAVLDTRELQILNTVSAIQRVEHKENAWEAALLLTAPQRVVNIEIIIIKVRIVAKLFMTMFIPERKYVAIKSKNVFSLISPAISAVKSPFNSSEGKKSSTSLGRELMKPFNSSSMAEVIFCSASSALITFVAKIIKINIKIIILVFFILI